MSTRALYVWDGILECTETGEDGVLACSWEGAYVDYPNCPDATKAPAPKRGTFDRDVKSDTHFLVKGTAKRPNESSPFTVSFTDGEGFDVDGTKVKDDSHTMLLMNVRWLGDMTNRKNLLFSVGSNQFGQFVSVGWMKPGNRLVLARRYISPGDPRAGWTVKDLQDATAKEIIDEEDVAIIPPWHIMSFNS